MFDVLFLISIFITLEFLCQLNMPKFSENHAHDMIDHCIFVCAVIVVFSLCYVMASMITILLV